MGNELKGEAFLTVGDTTYRLANTIDSILAIESLFSTPDKKVTWNDVIKEVERESVEHIRAVLWSFFQTYHPEVELRDIGRLMHEAGGEDVIVPVIKKVLMLAVPDAKDVAALGLRNPRKAQAVSPNSRGTGARSTSTRGGSV